MKTHCTNKPSSSSPGIGLRGPHIAEILATRPAIEWLEVHPENYIANEPALRVLEQIRNCYPLSLHGVSMSLGSSCDIDLRHVRGVAGLVERFDPDLVSEHLAWSRADDMHLNDLLPLPYTEEALAMMADHVDHAQCVLRRRILIENPSSYLRYRHSTMTEAEFLAELVRRTGCGVLLDVNNLYVSARNVGLDIAQFFAVLPGAAVGEIHLAGHAVNRVGDQTVLIDDHGSPVSPAVWSLLAAALRHCGPRPTLIEWDNALPTLEVLLSEAGRIRQFEAIGRGGTHADAA